MTNTQTDGHAPRGMNTVEERIDALDLDAPEIELELEEDAGEDGLEAWAIEDLARSGISEAEAVDAGMYGVKAPVIRRLLGFSVPDGTEGYAIPYRDPATGALLRTKEGDRPFVRVRFRRPVKLGESDAKYASPKGAGNRLYLTPQVVEACRRRERIFATEGEKKALAACLRGIPTIGLCGVYGWASRETQDCVEDLRPFMESGHELVFVVDSDAAVNVDIARAVWKLRESVRAKGGHMLYLIMPPHAEGGRIAKVGMDDLLVRDGPERLREVLSTATSVEGTCAELYAGWVLRFITWCAAQEIDPQPLAADILSKGFWDGITCAVRRPMMEEIRKHYPALAEALVHRMTQRLEDEFAGVQAPEHGGLNLANNKHVRVPGSDLPVKVDGLDGDVVYCFRPGCDHASRPYPRRLLELTEAPSRSAKNGLLGGPSGDSSTATDIANAFLTLPGNRQAGVCTLRFYRDRFYRYRDGVYRPLAQSDVEGQLMAFMRQHPLFSKQARKSTLADLVQHIKAFDAGGVPSVVEAPVWIDGQKFPRADGWTPMQNCMINIEALAQALNGAEIPGEDIRRDLTPKLFATTGLAYPHDPEADCPKFKAYLEEVLPEAEQRRAVQMMMGLCLVPDTSYNVFFMLFGEGGTGKMVLLWVVTRLVGIHNTCHVPFACFGEKFRVGRLTENLINIIGDGETACPDNMGQAAYEGVLKNMTDGGLLPHEVKFGAVAEYRATARCLAAVNSLPFFLDRSDGIWDRLRIVAFNVRVRGTDKQIRNYADVITRDELPGIFNFAVVGLAELRKLKGFPETAVGEQIKSRHRASCDHEREFLLEEYAEAEQDERALIGTQVLYNHYRAWMKSNGYRPCGKATFQERVKRVFPSVEICRPRASDGSRPHAWAGLKKQEISDEPLVEENEHVA